jgi:peptidoglycan/LPS O-acetylase OafA/YrhL
MSVGMPPPQSQKLARANREDVAISAATFSPKSPNLQISKSPDSATPKSPNLQISKSPHSPGQYRPQLDGLRAAAVLAVAWSHWERPYQFGIPFGSGVHLFYVLSGFLITGILMNIRAHLDRSRAVKAFYLRRALRIFPAFYLTLLLAWLAGLPLVRESVWWHAAYLSNVYTVVLGEWPGLISHFWSLAVEEQFYLVWPWLIVFAPGRWVAPGIGAAIVTAPLFRWWMASLGYVESMHAVLTPGCLDSLGVGAWLAYRSSVSGLSSRQTRALIAIALPAYVGALLLESLGIRIGFVVAIKQTLQAAVFGWVVLRAAEGFGGLSGRVLAAAPVVYIGRISYGVYLAHGFAGAMAATLFTAFGLAWPIAEPWRLLVLCSLTLGAAGLSWHLMERPINAMKRLVPYGS